MITVNTTPNMYGITLKGDYDDLNSLYDSLFDYLEFYNDSHEEFPDHEYEYLLSLNYDIRHCYQGDRNVEKAKDGHTYYSVEILYPLILHYMITFENILEEEPEESWLEAKNDFGEKWADRYSIMDARKDIGAISYLTSLFWINLRELLGRETIETIFNYYESVEYPIPAALYCDALIHCQLVNFDEMNETEKKSFLIASLYEIIGSDDIDDYSDEFKKDEDLLYKALGDLINRKVPRFPVREDFYLTLDNFHDPAEPLYEDVFQQFLDDTYGEDPDPFEEEEFNW